MRQVFKAEPYSPGALGSLGNAANMLIRQHQFPDTYAEEDRIRTEYHDRCIQWDYDHAHMCFKKHTNTGPLGLGGWVRRSHPDAIMAFIKELFKDDGQTKWTGFRVLGSVNLSSGYPVWALQLFANNSGAEVYSGPIAPNVEGSRKGVVYFGGY